MDSRLENVTRQGMENEHEGSIVMHSHTGAFVIH